VASAHTPHADQEGFSSMATDDEVGQGPDGPLPYSLGAR
jgi:hypothetical protein